MYVSLRGVVRWLMPALALVLILSVLAPHTSMAQQADSTAMTTAALNMRSGPGLSNAVVTVIPSGSTVQVTGSAQSGFLPVSWNGSSGWASANYLSVSGSGETSSGSATGSASTTASLNMRSGPGTGYSIIRVLPAGTTVSLTGQRSGEFVSIAYSSSYGWVSERYLTGGGASAAPAPQPEPAPAVGTATTTAALHLRSGPGSWNASLTVMPSGATVSVTGTARDGWLPITYNGISGWSASQYLRTGSAPAPAPAPEPAPPTSSSMVTTANLNMRSGPSLSNAVVTVIPAGSSVSVTGGAQSGFLPVIYSGSSGWASASYLREGSASSPSPAPGGGGSGIIWPVKGGTWSIIQGYNGGTHQNRSSTAQYYYALDIARTDGSTAGQPVYAPASGTVLWQDAGSGGIAIDMGNGYTIAMFHGTFDGSLGRGSRVSQGQYIGTVSGPGGAGYASTPHIDMTLWYTGGGGRAAAPYTGGNAISGMSFADTGGWNQHGGTTFNP
jgi:uncharacterized protein YraI